jgi:outer membrane lipopolysaccharide assembly protein LptE/RlpB
MRINIKISLLLAVVATLLTACKASFSFTGASISPEVKTVSIDFFPINATLAPPNSGQLFTEALKDIFISQTNLVLVKNDGDLQFEGYISDYSNNPVAIQGNEQAALTRITMTVKVTFTNTNDEKQNFESNFSRFEDLNASEDLASREEELINAINEQLTQDIFNKAVTNW